MGEDKILMPTYTQATNAVFTAFKSGMDTNRPNVVIAWPNLDFDPQTSFVASTHEAWARVTMRTIDAGQITLGDAGARRFRYSAALQVEIYTPLGNGQSTALAIADDIVSILRGITTQGVRIKVPEIIAEGRDDPFYHVNVITPIEYDDIG